MSSWKSLLLRIGENCPEYGGITDFKDHIETCSGVVRRELEHSETDILHYIVQCAEQFPHKIPLYGTVVGLLNLENEDFVRKVVENTQTTLQDALVAGNCNRIRIMMRFLTVMMCSKVLQPSSLVVVYETLLSSAATTVDEERGNPSWQACADFYITCILSCLPWGGAELVEQVPEEIERVMVGVEAYLRIRRHTSDIGFAIFEDVDYTEKALDEKDFLEDLWGRIQDLSSNGWKLESVPRPHLSFEAQLVAGKAHDLEPINCPEQPDPPAVLSAITCGKQKHEAELKYPQRIRRLNIFPANKTEDLQPIDRFVVEEYLLDVLLFLNGCRKECASCMVGLPVPFRYEYLMAETIFSQLLLLPHPPFKPMYYTLVIIDLCKALPGAFPAVVAGAVRALFDKIADLDMECRTRLILWFSHHLSNFQFIWPWEEWAYVLDLPKWAPQRVFVQEVLEREVRLSYWDKVKQSIENAPALEELLPPKGGPNFKYSGEDGTEHALSVELSGMVKARQTIREVISWMEENVMPAHGFEITLSVIVQTLLDIGSKSFTHLITVLERYGQVIARICTDQDKQVMLIAEVSSYWKNSAQMTAIAIDRMMGYRLISNLAIVRWVFSPANIEQFHTTDHPWEILRNAVNKTYNRISDLRKEISVLKNSVVSAEEAATKAKAELEGAEAKLTLVDGEPVLGENPARLKRLKANAEKTKEAEVSVCESLEAKEALLARALEENEALFLSLFKNFSTVMMERIHDAFRDGTLRQSHQADEMAIDLEDSSAMELDKEDGKPKKSHSNGERANGFNVGEKQQWCLSTLGYVKAFSRQYASEIWPHIEKLDAEVFTENVHPLFRKAVYSGLNRPLNDLGSGQ
ncbi:Nuclear cap-binding protein subunit 1 [Camellia lanceoleosa]|uniref:Nuclear cap-binding protein subunit 1 n=1 Tax=Camellia lanceoleosa TaxID=1840588 RepID=A0ACC0I788_9ERIC|nr:Nuclear cap-binding protein subunit 1 [Camellia lanceoleosa]